MVSCQCSDMLHRMSGHTALRQMDHVQLQDTYLLCYPLTTTSGIFAETLEMNDLSVGHVS